MPKVPQFPLSPDLAPLLSRHGIATQYFPRYVNTRFEPHTLDVLLLSFIVQGTGMLSGFASHTSGIISDNC